MICPLYPYHVANVFCFTDAHIFLIEPISDEPNIHAIDSANNLIYYNVFGKFPLYHKILDTQSLLFFFYIFSAVTLFIETHPT